MSETAWISTATAAEIWGLSQESVRRAVRLGEVGWKRKGSRGRLMVSADDVEAQVITRSRRAGSGDAAGGGADADRRAACG
jgi:hypothetical protein